MISKQSTTVHLKRGVQINKYGVLFNCSWTSEYHTLIFNQKRIKGVPPWIFRSYDSPAITIKAPLPPFHGFYEFHGTVGAVHKLVLQSLQAPTVASTSAAAELFESDRRRWGQWQLVAFFFYGLTRAI